MFYDFLFSFLFFFVLQDQAEAVMSAAADAAAKDPFGLVGTKIVPKQ